jgi:integrase/recombinase XerD
MTELEAVIANSKRLAPPTRKQYRIAVRSFVRFAGTDPRVWTPAAADAWAHQLTVGDRSKNVYIAGLRYASRRWAALYEARDFAGALETILVPAETQTHSPTPLDESQLDAMLSTCARQDSPVDLRDRAILAVALHAGFRRAEVAKIKFEDLDRRDRSIVVVAKRNRRHRVRVSAECWVRIEAWITWLKRRHVVTTGKGRVFRALRKCLDKELSWCVAESLSDEAVYRIVRRRAKRAGIGARVCAHTLRHSLVAILRKRGVSEIEIARRVGHARVETTALYGGEVVRDAGDDGLPT